MMQHMNLTITASETEENRTRGPTKRSRTSCPVCKNSQSSKNLRRHLRSHNWTADAIRNYTAACYTCKPPITCPACHKPQTTKGIRRHLRKKHEWTDEEVKKLFIPCHNAEFTDGEPTCTLLDECTICGALVSFVVICCIF